MRYLALFISYIFHPLLFITYGLVFLMWSVPEEFGSVNLPERAPVLAFSVFALTFLLPAFAVLLMKMLNLINSLHLKTKEERTVPFISTITFYLWLCVNMYYNQVFPQPFEIFVFGSTMALFVAFFINIFNKISLHAVGMGGLVGLMIYTMLIFSYENLELPLLLTIFAAGLVGTCRLYLGAHQTNEVYGGYLVGFVTQFIALRMFY